MLLGWGISDPSVTELPAMFTRYLSVSDGRIFASALLGLIGIPVECLCWFAIYRMIQPYSEKDAHAYRAGIIGCLAFGGCGVHMPCCAAVYLVKRFYANDPATVADEALRWIGWFFTPRNHPVQRLLLPHGHCADQGVRRRAYAAAPPVLGVFPAVRTDLDTADAAHRGLWPDKRAGDRLDQRREPVDVGRPVH